MAVVKIIPLELRKRILLESNDVLEVETYCFLVHPMKGGETMDERNLRDTKLKTEFPQI